MSSRFRNCVLVGVGPVVLWSGCASASMHGTHEGGPLQTGLIVGGAVVVVVALWLVLRMLGK